jgi:exonuclease III
MVCLQETKMQYIARSTLVSVLGSEFTEYVFLPSDGASGGILVAWKNHLRYTDASRVDNHSVSIQFHKQEGGTWWLTCVYGPQGDEEKISFLQELRNVREGCNGPWVVAGDFNLIYKTSNKNNNNFNRAMMGCFRSFINDLALKEVPLHGRRFTWSNQQVEPILVRLDMVLCLVD